MSADHPPYLATLSGGWYFVWQAAMRRNVEARHSSARGPEGMGLKFALRHQRNNTGHTAAMPQNEKFRAINVLRMQ